MLNGVGKLEGETFKMKVLVTYYSRTGNTEKVAQCLKEGLEKGGAEVDFNPIELKKEINILKGIWWSILGKTIPIKIKHNDVQQYDMIFLGGPVWVGNPCAAINTFIDNCEHIEGKKTVVFLTLSSKGAQSALEKLSQRFKKRRAQVIDTFEFSTGPKGNSLKGVEMEKVVEFGRDLTLKW